MVSWYCQPGIVIDTFDSRSGCGDHDDHYPDRDDDDDNVDDDDDDELVGAEGRITFAGC